jgi:hypothetical protein
VENESADQKQSEVGSGETKTAAAASPNVPVLKELTAKDVFRNVLTYTYLIAGFVIPLLLLSFVFASEAQWYGARRLEELTSGRCFPKTQTDTPNQEWFRFRSNPDFPKLGGKLEFSAEISPQPTKNARDRIQCQIEELFNRTQHHGAALSKLFGLYTSSIIMSGVTSAVAAIVLLFITSSGWNNAHNYAKAIFLVAVATAGYYVAFPKIFLLEDNIAANKEHFLQYIALTDEICSYAATGEGYILKESISTANSQNVANKAQNTDDKVGQSNLHSGTTIDELVRLRHADPAAFIAYMDSELRHWNTVAVGFDQSKNPDFRKMFDEWLKSK